MRDESVTGADGPGTAGGRELLRNIRILAELSDEDLDQLVQGARMLRAAPGTEVIREGDPGDALYLVLTGEVEVFRRVEGEEVLLSREGPGSFVGEMALLGRSPRTASVRTVGPVDFLVLGAEPFRELLAHSPTASLTILRTVAARLRNTERTLVERERLATLGSLTAGLAHELNNPSAALPRAAEYMERLIGDWGRRMITLAGLDLDAGARAGLASLEALLREAPPPGRLMPSVSAEMAIEEWLEALGVEGAWDLAAPIAIRGWTPERLSELAAPFGSAAAPVIGWLATGWAMRGLAEEVAHAASAVSSVVGAVRMYAYHDREAVLGPVELCEAIGHALTLLRHRMDPGIELRVHLPPELPLVQGNAADLGQLWTILIENALDAMGGKGVLEIAAAAGDGEVEVEVADSGSGIDPALAKRIFDPFFTTKPPGKGTGLGLAIADRIVQDHHGTIRMESEPGRTVFRVTIPTAVAITSQAP